MTIMISTYSRGDNCPGSPFIPPDSDRLLPVPVACERCGSRKTLRRVETLCKHEPFKAEPWTCTCGGIYIPDFGGDTAAGN